MSESSHPLIFLACCSALSLLTGCGTVADVHSFSTPYTSPTTGDTARLRVISEGMVRGVPRSDCLDFRRPDAGVMVVGREGYANRNGELLGMAPPGTHPASAVMSELKIPAGQPMAFHYLGDRCYNTFSFVPEPGMDYELDATSVNVCSVTLKKMNPGEKMGRFVPLGKSTMCKWGDNL